MKIDEKVEMPDEIKELIKNGKTFEAAKMYSETNNVDFPTAKDAIESFVSENAPGVANEVTPTEKTEENASAKTNDEAKENRSLITFFYTVGTVALVFVIIMIAALVSNNSKSPDSSADHIKQETAAKETKAPETKAPETKAPENQTAGKNLTVSDFMKKRKSNSEIKKYFGNADEENNNPYTIESLAYKNKFTFMGVKVKSYEFSSLKITLGYDEGKTEYRNLLIMEIPTENQLKNILDALNSVSTHTDFSDVLNIRYFYAGDFLIMISIGDTLQIQFSHY